MEDHKILCGDPADLLKTLQAGSVDLVVTDPPYLVNYKDRDGRTIANDTNPDAVLSVFDQVYRVLKDDSYCISFYGWNAVAAFSNKWAELGFRVVGHIVWYKPYASKTAFAEYRHESAFILAKGKPALPKHPISDVQPWAYSGNKAHPTEKAVSVITPLIRSFSKPGDVVLDPFMGSGSTNVAAALNGRRSIGIDCEQRYCDHALKRLGGVRRYKQAA